MSTTEEQLKLHVEAVETMLEQKKEILDDIKDRKTLIKSEGFDLKVFDALIKRRAMERADVEEFDAVLETYESALA